MMRNRRCSLRSKSAAFTLLEIMISLTIFMIAMIPISWTLMRLTKDSTETVLHTRAVFLAQEKAEEILRDDTVAAPSTTGRAGAASRQTSDWEMTKAIRQLSTPTDPKVCPSNPQLYYCYNGSSILYDSSTPEGANNIARVIILRNYVEPSQITGKDVIYELRFHE
ncbi:MAG: prepilin-type N-terminal cleavage/methylation domain-containing protein [Candidatus Sumerlaeales bacterium]|nr:prepilin-type N-terminal cleavage/methylation domain-containing protein [Candidatus Sumerlaeales bacterium]